MASAALPTWALFLAVKCRSKIFKMKERKKERSFFLSFFLSFFEREKRGGHTNTHTCVYMYVCIHTYVCVHTCTHTHMCVCAHTCTHTYILRVQKQGKGQAEGEGEVGSLLSKKPDVGLDPRNVGS